MASFAGSRPGGRSARIQRSVHDAVRWLERERGRDGITVPIVAETAGVAATTIYRRWGDLDALLADVAAERFRDPPSPEETGSLVGDLRAWAEQFLEESSSGPGRCYVVDLVRGDLTGAAAETAADRCRAAFREILNRHPAEAPFAIEEAIDGIVAPLIFRILFSTQAVEPEYAASLVDGFMRARGEHSAHGIE